MQLPDGLLANVKPSILTIQAIPKVDLKKKKFIVIWGLDTAVSNTYNEDLYNSKGLNHKNLHHSRGSLPKQMHSVSRFSFLNTFIVIDS